MNIDKPVKNQFKSGWNVESFSPDNSLSQVKDALFRIHAHWDVVTESAQPSFATIASNLLGHLMVTLIDIPPLEAVRNPSLIEKDDDRYSVMLTLNGKHLFRQGSKELMLEEGMLTVWNMSCPTYFQTTERFKLCSLIIPGRQMRAMVPSIDDCCAKSLDTRTGEGFLLATQLKALSETLTHPEWRGSAAIANACLQFVAATLNSSHLLTKKTDKKKNFQNNIRTYILNNLHDECLSPRLIADAFGVSPAYIHRIFQKSSFTISGWIRYSRLQLSREMLADEVFNNLSITEICYRCGFSDSSHFCRVFCKEFGERPSDVRRKLCSTVEKQ